MNKIKAIITQHRKAALGVFFVLVIFVGGSVASAMSVAQRRAQQGATQTGQLAEEEAETSEGDEDASLSDSQKSAIEAYDDDTLALIDTLSASVWSGSDGRCTLRFSDDTYTETVDGEATVHPYAVLRVDKESDDLGGSLYTIVFETDTGTHVVTYSDGKGVGAATGNEATTVLSTLSSASMFTLRDAPYKRADAVENLAVKGLNSEVTQLLGDDADGLATKLSQWCAVCHPTAREAIWNGTAYVDWTNSLISTDFTLNGEATVTVTAIYHMDTGAYEFDG